MGDLFPKTFTPKLYSSLVWPAYSSTHWGFHRRSSWFVVRWIEDELAIQLFRPFSKFDRPSSCLPENVLDISSSHCFLHLFTLFCRARIHPNRAVIQWKGILNLSLHFFNAFYFLVPEKGIIRKCGIFVFDGYGIIFWIFHSNASNRSRKIIELVPFLYL